MTRVVPRINKTLRSEYRARRKGLLNMCSLRRQLHRIRSVLWAVYPQCSALLRACRNSQIESVAFFVPEAGACSDCSRDFSQWFIVIRVGLLNDGNETLASGRINSFTTSVIVHIVRVVNTRDVGDLTHRCLNPARPVVLVSGLRQRG